MKIENMLQRFSCISFLFKPPWFDEFMIPPSRDKCSKKIKNGVKLTRLKPLKQNIMAEISQNKPLINP